MRRPIEWEDLEQRSRLGRFIPRSVLPAQQPALVEAARSAGAPQDVVDELSRLPADREYHTVYDIWDALGHENEPRSSTGAPKEKG